MGNFTQFDFIRTLVADCSIDLMADKVPGRDKKFGGEAVPVSHYYSTMLCISLDTSDPARFVREVYEDELTNLRIYGKTLDDRLRQNYLEAFLSQTDDALAKVVGEARNYARQIRAVKMGTDTRRTFSLQNQKDDTR